VPLLPHFDDTVPPTCKDDRWFKGMPNTGNRGSLVMRLEFLHNSGMRARLKGQSEILSQQIVRKA
jgi:hypothetical protein